MTNKAIFGVPFYEYEKGPYVWALVAHFSDGCTCNAESAARLMCCDEVTALYEWEEGRDSFFAEYGRDPNHEYELRKMRVDIL